MAVINNGEFSVETVPTQLNLDIFGLRVADGISKRLTRNLKDQELNQRAGSHILRLQSDGRRRYTGQSVAQQAQPRCYASAGTGRLRCTNDGRTSRTRTSEAASPHNPKYA